MRNHNYPRSKYKHETKGFFFHLASCAFSKIGFLSLATVLSSHNVSAMRLIISTNFPLWICGPIHF